MVELYGGLLPAATIKKSLKFYNKFYKIINDPAMAESSFDSACKGPYIPKNIAVK